MNPIARIKRKIVSLICEPKAAPTPAKWIPSLPKELMEKLPEGQKLTVLDIGGYKGEFSAGLLESGLLERGYIIEAHPELFLGLQDRFKGTPVIPKHCALSDKIGKIILNSFSVGGTSSILKMNEKSSSLQEIGMAEAGSYEVATTTLDHLWTQLGSPKVDLMKIDVQGAELIVLGQGEDCLRATERVWIEVSFEPLYHNSALFPEVYSFMSSRGFGMHVYSPVFQSKAGEILQADLLFVKRQKS
jgi:FkbM family methyltransferase